MISNYKNLTKTQKIAIVETSKIWGVIFGTLVSIFLLIHFLGSLLLFLGIALIGCIFFTYRMILVDEIQKEQMHEQMQNFE